MKKVLELAHDLIKDVVSKDDITIDMTMGNGNDTLFLANISSFVYAFDIQEEALNNTTRLLESNELNNYKLILDSHENIDNYITFPFKACIYNLGFLPRNNRNITTHLTSTLESIKKAMNLISKGGVIIVVVYEGHKEGKEEGNGLKEYLSNINQKEFDIARYGFINQINDPPYLYAIYKK